ncbi:MAG: methionine adenosyltransferase [Pseudomonadota bacterium]|nr:methionine adenosyltransferase [Pseudomonadota bacterium]MEC7734954.1 methionine adenosyltransferase [Pseudomonadota bacterium]MEC9392423.1 methionine adenosyltransferase [Pseudomonadota bacterium]MEC9458450.1 methionine adenosyltransferase [Pseudomonadota bacterium]MED5436697.1 methionine adenosyltransferase [Pseudomonadota bacterium]
MKESKNNYFFTSESVSEGHPDKVCDKISDTILDAYLTIDKNARVAVEALVTTNLVIVSGEINSRIIIPENEIILLTREVIKNIGYDFGDFNWESLEVKVFLHEQSPDIAIGVDAKEGNSEGAGDQGIMFGYACNETDQFMPATLLYSHYILKELAEMRHAKGINGILPDSKSQITLFYENDKPSFIDSIVVSTQHHENTSQEYINTEIDKICRRILPNEWYRDETKLLTNPTGKFVVGGPVGDTGLTGRKIIVDTYGGAAPHGGGAFSGKDPTKVDRSAAYASRYLAKNIVSSGISDKCTIQLSYAIGIREPLSLYIDLHNSDKVDLKKVEDFIRNRINLSPRGIIDLLGLNNPIYSETSAYGHFGREPTKEGAFSWEKLDLSEELKNEFL